MTHKLKSDILSMSRVVIVSVSQDLQFFSLHCLITEDIGLGRQDGRGGIKQNTVQAFAANQEKMSDSSLQ